MVKINNNGGYDGYIRRRIYGGSTKSIVHGQIEGERTSARAAEPRRKHTLTFAGTKQV